MISVPDELPFTSIKAEQPLPDRHLIQNYPLTRALVIARVSKGGTAVLQLSSVIISGGYPNLLNPAHKHFRKIKLLRAICFRPQD